jgi:cytosine/adenosine deaminase-related metal-dependent hydrolase
VEPAALALAMNAPEEAPMRGFEGYMRLVNRNPKTVRTVLINGRVAVENGEPLEALGRQRGFGRVLRAQDRPA